MTSAVARKLQGSVQEPSARARERSGFGRWLRTPGGARVVSVIAFFGIWQLVVPVLPTDQLPLPGEVFAFMWDELRGETVARQNVYYHFGVTLLRLLIGLAITFTIGTAIGVLMGVSRAAYAMFHDFILGLLAMPYLVWALAVALWFGFDWQTPILVVVLGSIAFVIINVVEGVRNVPKDLVDMARAYGVSRRSTLRHLVIPSLMPFLFAAARYGGSLGWKALVLAEIFGARDGAGWMLKFWYDAHRVTGLIGYAFFFVVFTLVVDQLFFTWVGNRVFRWRPKIAAA